MLYLAKCPKCKTYNVVQKRKQINPKSKAVQRFNPCAKCKTVTRQRVIGRIEKIRLLVF